MPRQALLWAMLAAPIALLVLWQTRGQTFYADEWFFFVHAAGSSPGWHAEPDQGNMVLGTVLVYKATLALAGAHDHLALRLVWVLLDLLSSTLFFFLMRARVGAFAAIVPAVVLSLFGASWEVFGSSLGINVLSSVAAGLGALLALERRSPVGDTAACLLLTFSVGSHSTGLAFAAWAGAFLLISRERWMRAWVVAVPLLLYAAWAIWARKFGQSGVSLQTLSSAPAAVISLLESASASMSGAFRFPGPRQPEATNLVIFVNKEPGILLAALLVGAVAWRLRRLRLQWRLLPPFAALLVYWTSLALVSPAREPTAGRYQYASALLLLLLLGELWRGSRPSRGVSALIAVLGLIALVPNVVNLHYAAQFVRSVGNKDMAQLAIVDRLRDRIPPETLIEPLPGNLEADMRITAGSYFAAVDSFGSPADSLAQLPYAGVVARQAADRELVHLLGVEPRPMPAGRDAIAPGPGCRVLAPGKTASGGGFQVPDGGFAFVATSGAQVTVGLRRYSDDFYTFPPVPGGSAYRVRVPRDGVLQRWHAALESNDAVRICPPGS